MSLNYHHTYPARINANVYDDLIKLKDLESRSINSFLNEGARLVREKYIGKIAQERKNRNTLDARHSSWFGR